MEMLIEFLESFLGETILLLNYLTHMIQKLGLVEFMGEVVVSKIHPLKENFTLHWKKFIKDVSRK